VKLREARACAALAAGCRGDAVGRTTNLLQISRRLLALALLLLLLLLLLIKSQLLLLLCGRRQ
jgi:hypothetical protein